MESIVSSENLFLFIGKVWKTYTHTHTHTHWEEPSGIQRRMKINISQVFQMSQIKNWVESILGKITLFNAQDKEGRKEGRKALVTLTKFSNFGQTINEVEFMDTFSSSK